MANCSSGCRRPAGGSVRKRRSVVAPSGGIIATGDDMATIRQAEPIRTLVGTAAEATSGADRRWGATVEPHCRHGACDCPISPLSHVCGGKHAHRALAGGNISARVHRRPAGVVVCCCRRAPGCVPCWAAPGGGSPVAVAARRVTGRSHPGLRLSKSGRTVGNDVVFASCLCALMCQI